MPKQKAMLIDIKKCDGCESSAAACRQLHGFNTNPEPALCDTAFTVVEPRGDKFVRKVCMHCNDPACPVGAIKKTALGPVVYDAAKCIGCRYSMLACCALCIFSLRPKPDTCGLKWGCSWCFHSYY